MDRNKYYEKLALADSGEEEATLEWCLYVLDGLRKEIEKIDKLLDVEYLTQSILLPTLKFSLERKYITDREFSILNALVKSDSMTIKSSDLEKVIGQESSVQRSRILKKLKEKNILIPLAENGRIYTIGFVNNYLLRGIMYVLEENEFIPASLNEKN
jgi:Fic family protein